MAFEEPWWLPYFSLVCTCVHCTVYCLALDPYWPYFVMAAQMVLETFLQADMTPLMVLHHAANMVITMSYLISPTFETVILTGLIVELPSLPLLINKIFGRKFPSPVRNLLKLAFSLGFLYSRLVSGWMTCVEPGFIWGHSDLSKPYLSDAAADLWLRVNYSV
jgi:hypothetical protein